MKKKLAAVGGVVLLAASATACGSEDHTKELNTWAKKVCGPAKPQIKSAQTALADTGRVHKGEKPNELRTRLSRDIGKLVTANNKLAQAIDGAGKPAVDNGEKLQTKAVKSLHKTASGYGRVKEKVDGLDTKKQEEFADGLTKASTRMQKLAKSSQTALKKLQRGDPGEALAKQHGCQKIDPASLPSPSASAASPGKSGGKSDSGKEDGGKGARTSKNDPSTSPSKKS